MAADKTMQRWYGTLWDYFLPARAVIKRELLTGLRSPRPFLFLAAFMVIMILGLLLLLEVVYAHRIKQAGAIDADFVAMLFMDFSRSLYLSAILLVPPMAAVSICMERQQDSYDLLRMTYIRPLSLAVAKLSNVLGIYLLIVLATLPFVGVAFFLIGIDWHQFVATFALIILSAFSLSVIGLLCSAKYEQTLPAIIATYILGYGAQGGLMIAVGLIVALLAPGSIPGQFLDDLPTGLVAALIPFDGIELVGDRWVGLDILPYAFAYHGTIIVLGLYLTMRTLRRPPTNLRVNTAPPIDHTETLTARRGKFPFYLVDPRRRRPLISDRHNPIYAKERNASVLSQGTAAIRLFYGFAVFSFLVSLVNMDLYGKHNQIPQMAAWTFHYVTLFIVMLAPALVATATAREWEWENVDSLRSTLLPARAVFWGKFQAALHTAMIPVAGAVLGSFPLYIFGRDTWDVWRAATMGASLMVVAVVYTLAVSLWAAVQCRRSMTALLTAYGACVVALGLAPFIAAILARATIGRFHDLANEEWLYAFLSPLFAFYTMAKRGAMANTLSINTYWVANGLFFLALSGLLLWFTCRRFDRAIRQEL